MELLTIRLNKIVAKKLMKGAGETLILEKKISINMFILSLII
ncbi:hypothetical protein OBG91_01885 [Lactococcus lactis]|nr:hypothetical protein [Lactococcus lactis]